MEAAEMGNEIQDDNDDEEENDEDNDDEDNDENENAAGDVDVVIWHETKLPPILEESMIGRLIVRCGTTRNAFDVGIVVTKIRRVKAYIHIDIVQTVRSTMVVFSMFIKGFSWICVSSLQIGNFRLPT